MLVPALAVMILQALAPAAAPATNNGAPAGQPGGSAAPAAAGAEAAPAASDAAEGKTGAAAKKAGAPSVAPAPVPAAPAKPLGKTLWLMQPLYPGQELLVGRTEEAISNLLPASDRTSEIVGRRELASALGNGSEAVECIFGETRCADPIGALVSGVGIERVVLVKVGQEGTGYRVRAASFQPGSFEAATAESEGASLEKALLSSVVRVAPLAALLEVRSEPAGAMVFVDGEKVGVTPLSTQVLPGERTIRIELVDYRVLEKKEQIPVRGKAQVAGTLQQLPGKLHVVSAGARIFVDGQEAGSDEVQVATPAGKHVVSLHRDGYQPYETEVEVTPDDTTKLEHDLDPTFWKSVVQTASKEQDEIYKESGYFSFHYENRTLTSSDFGARILSFSGELDRVQSPSTKKANVQSFGLEYGSLWRYVGMTWFGASYFRTSDPWTFAKAGKDVDPDEDIFEGTIDGGTLRLVQPQLRIALWRFVLGVRGGFSMGMGVASGANVDKGNNYFFGGIDAEAMGTLQLRVVDGLFVEGGYGRTWGLVSFFGKPGGSDNLRFGVGYAF